MRSLSLLVAVSKRRHVLGGIVGLEPCGLIGDEAVTRGVDLVESVARRTARSVSNRSRHRPLVVCPWATQPATNFSCWACITDLIFLPMALPQVVGVGHRVSRHLLGDLTSPAPGTR